jgi:hypothetical protein
LREGQARDAAAVPSEINGVAFGVFFTKALVNQLAHAQFKSSTVTGHPEIHVTGLTGVDFTPSHTIETNVKGYLTTSKVTPPPL